MSRPEDEFLISYKSLRKFIGILGLVLPWVLLLGGWLVFNHDLQASLSAYYHTRMRDVFVGAICAIGVFLLTYRGNERKDDIAGKLACVFAVGLALFPTSQEGAVGDEVTIGRWHFAFAAAFLLTLVYFSLFLFTKKAPHPTPEKLIRNRVYRTCGWLMLACVIGIAGVKTLHVEDYHVVFWLETIAILAFGVSWLVKGEAILADKTKREPVPVTAAGGASGG